jgi:hypothetical protein
MVDFICPDFKDAGSLPRKGGGVLSTYTAYRDNLIQTPCINFDYPDTDELANFAQQLDLNCLNTVFENIPQGYTTIGLGTSRGAVTLLKRELMNEGKNRPCALVLESPILSITDVASQIAKKFVWNLPLMPSLAYYTFCLINPGFDPKEDNLENMLATKKISPDLPILFVHLKNDPTLSDKAMFTMVKALACYNPNIHLLVLNDTTKTAHHGELHHIEAFQHVANTFYRSYNLPHNALLADKGEKFFEITKENVYKAASPKNWRLVSC